MNQIQKIGLSIALIGLAITSIILILGFTYSEELKEYTIKISDKEWEINTKNGDFVAYIIEEGENRVTVTLRDSEGNLIGYQILFDVSSVEGKLNYYWKITENTVSLYINGIKALNYRW